MLSQFDQSYYEKARKYADKPFWLFEVGMMVHAARHILPGVHMLDFGCNDGKMGDLFSKLGHAGMVDGVDVNKAAVGTGLNHNRRVNFLTEYTGDLIPTKPNTYGLVTCLNTLGHVEDPVKVLRDIKWVMQHGALLVISCSNWNHYWVKDFQSRSTDPTLIHEWTPRTIRRLLETVGFQSVKVETYGRRLPVLMTRARMLVTAVKP